MLIDPVRELKVRAELLQKDARKGDPRALARLRVLPELRKKDDAAVRAIAREIQRKHCLAAIALETGFASFVHARRVLEGDAREMDFGKLLYRRDWGTYLNEWFSTYEEARARLDETPEKYLLAWKRQFFLVEAGFIEALGLDPHDEDWTKLNRDWARPADREARRRLYAKLLRASQS